MTKTTTCQVLLYVPNLIGYARIVLLLASLRTMLHDPYVTASLYMLSALLDAFDGMAARRLNQCTKFGAMLDQLTDRVATSMLLMALSVLYPAYTVCSLYFYAFTELGGLIPILVTLSAPVALVKSSIALVQLCYAARNLAELDAIEASKDK